MKHIQTFENFLNEAKTSIQIMYDKSFDNTTIQGVSTDGHFKGITAKGNFADEWKKYSDIDSAIRSISKDSKYKILSMSK